MSNDTSERKAQTRAVFNRIARDYDTTGPGCFLHFGRRLVNVVGIDPGQDVLDIATGRGAVLIPAAERVGAAGRIIGIDLAEEMVRGARDEAARRGLSTEIRVMDAERLDFPDASFDRVLCGFGIMFFPSLDQALSEFRRVLQPFGRLGVSTWRVTQADDLAAVLAQLGIVDPGGDARLFSEPGDLERVLVAAGFSSVRVVVDSTTFHYVDVEQYWQNARGTGLRRWLDALDPAQTERVRFALDARLRPYHREDGVHVPAAALLAVARC